MASGRIMTAFSLGVLLLAVALLFPTFLDAQSQDASATDVIELNTSQEVSDQLQVNATSINTSGPNATLRYESLETHNRTSATIDEGNSTTLTIDGQDINTTVESVRSSSAVVVQTSYPNTFGLASGPASVITNFGTLLVILAGVLVFGLTAKIALGGP